MDRENARQEIRSRVKCTDYLQKSKSGMYCCPFCGSGTGPHGTGALKVYPTNTWTCHACSKSGDVIDLYQQQTGTDYNTALSLMAESIGITIDRYNPDETATKAAAPEKQRTGRPTSDFNGEAGTNTQPDHETQQRAAETQIEGTADYTAYYEECRQRITDPAAAAYLQSRGISMETAAAYWIGYDPAADPANAPGATQNDALFGVHKPHPCPRLIIPTSRAHYIGRRIDGGKELTKLNPAKDKGAASPAIFNNKALYAPGVQEIFVTEGAFDALSIIEAGYPAIALNSAANRDALIKQLEERRTDATLILCLDNDKAGKEATAALSAGLQRLNISFITADVCAGYKDPNEALTGNRAAFMDALAEAQRHTAAKPDNTAYYIDALMSAEIARFKQDKKTGFANLDAQAGGLYAGLYVLAAISSLGKTSFALQLADQLAENGNDVIFFSLEQSRLELVSKSLARRTAQKDRAQGVTSLAIRKGYLPRQVLDAAAEYKAAVADRISIVEGNFACNIPFIGNYARRYIEKNNARPVVIIDYLQILQPADERQTAKDAIDSAVTELRQMSRELDLTIIIISSVNRANYLTPIDFESLKESGGIEFTADVVWGLQLQCLHDPIFDKEKNIKEKREKIKEAKAANPRKIELSCLKNRYGIANYSCYFNYYPANDLFTEDNGTPDTGKQEETTWQRV